MLQKPGGLRVILAVAMLFFKSSSWEINSEIRRWLKAQPSIAGASRGSAHVCWMNEEVRAETAAGSFSMWETAFLLSPSYVPGTTTSSGHLVTNSLHPLVNSTRQLPQLAPV